MERQLLSNILLLEAKTVIHPTIHYKRATLLFPLIISAAFSAIIIHVALRLADVISGMIEASTTRKRLIPFTLKKKNEMKKK